MSRKSNRHADNPVIIETIVTTVDRDGQPHIAPIGVHVHDEGYVIAPFRPSRTLDNLLASGGAVINLTDDVRVFAGCLTGRRDAPLAPASVIKGVRLAGALTHREVQVIRVEDDAQRPRFICRQVHEQQHRGLDGHTGFNGFNRAQAAVIEAAILVSRLDRLPRARIEQEIDYLRIAIDKTAGAAEREAWDWLIERIEGHFGRMSHERVRALCAQAARPGLLASVNQVAEVDMVLAAGVDVVDVVDVHEPGGAALGAAGAELIRDVVKRVSGAKLVCATLGAVPMQAEQLLAASEACADCGVDAVKIGLQPDARRGECIGALQALAQRLPVVAVLFADRDLPQVADSTTVLEQLAGAGFAGVVLDTFDKKAGRLTALWDSDSLQRWVAQAQALKLLVGLAGSLRVEDIAGLVKLKPDLLGFRGALCGDGDRSAQLDPIRVKEVRRIIGLRRKIEARRPDPASALPR